MKNKLIACCGIDCATCDARIATVENNDELRKATALRWQKLYNIPSIPFESIRCTGCLEAGEKIAHCYACEIKKCAQQKGYTTCGECAELETCSHMAPVISHVSDTVTNLRQLLN